MTAEVSDKWFPACALYLVMGEVVDLIFYDFLRPGHARDQKED